MARRTERNSDGRRPETAKGATGSPASPEGARAFAPTVACVLLLALTIAVYARTAHHGFLNLDDPAYVTENPRVNRGLTAENVVWAFTGTAAANWHPVTWLSHMADVELFGVRPGPHHLVNVAIHVLCSLLLYRLLAELTGARWKGLSVAALFALHPLHVESVAWVAERKDVLSCLFLLLTLLAYARYARRPAAGSYLLALGLFAVGLMAKPMLVTLPVLLLLLDYWPLGRFGEGAARPSRGMWRLLGEKVPFLLLSLLSSAVTIYAQRAGGAVNTLEVRPPGLRVQNALVAYAKYLGSTLFPRDLAIYYPFPVSIGLTESLGALLLLAAISAAAYRLRARRPYLAVGWAWFLVTLLPVIGLLQVGSQARADRYTYIPLIGVFVAVVWGASDLAAGWKAKRAILGTAGAAVVLACAAATWGQLGYWRDPVLLYRHALESTAGNYVVLNNLGSALSERGDKEGALRAFEEAVRAWPESSAAESNLGDVLADLGRLPEAVSHLERALALDPTNARAEMNLARALAGLGAVADAVRHYERAIVLDPQLPKARYNLAYLLVQLGRVEDGWRHYTAGLGLRPAAGPTHNKIGLAFARQGLFEQAAYCFRQALAVDPTFEEAQVNLRDAEARR
ncbi:MAG: tetratricopeptide repeat protein [Deltaproteobacteria bacterium]|nr:tetratricopeptide repeat protein [Deltaproteobacteria bacterium]